MMRKGQVSGVCTEQQALIVSFLMWLLLMGLHVAGYNDMVSTTLITVSAFLVGFLTHKLGFVVPHSNQS